MLHSDRFGFAPSWQAAISIATEILAQAGVPSPHVDALELAQLSGARRPYREEPSAEQRERFHDLITQREARIPLQHITGVMYFRYLTLTSRPGCFIVRPETEIVVEEALKYVQPGDTVVDLCTGSGAIALSLASECAGTQVWGVEKSAEAFALACENNERYGSPVTFIHDDARTALADLEGKVNLVISNPPYVPSGVEHSPEVQADPDMALWGGGEDGLELPAQIVERARKLLAPGGVFVMEHDVTQGAALRALASSYGFLQVRTGKDLTGRDRYLWARLP